MGVEGWDVSNDDFFKYNPCKKGKSSSMRSISQPCGVCRISTNVLPVGERVILNIHNLCRTVIITLDVYICEFQLQSVTTSMTCGRFERRQDQFPRTESLSYKLRGRFMMNERGGKHILGELSSITTNCTKVRDSEFISDISKLLGRWCLTYIILCMSKMTLNSIIF